MSGMPSPSGLAANVFEDSDNTEAVLKSLIDANGLSTMSARVGRRLQAIEAAIRKLQGRFDGMAEEFVPREDFRAVEKLGPVVLSHTADLVDLRGIVMPMSALNDSHGVAVQSCATRLDALETSVEAERCRVDTIQQELCQFKELEVLKTKFMDLAQEVHNSDARHMNFHAKHEATQESLRGDMDEVEQRMRLFCKAEIVREQQKMLSGVSDEDDDDTNGGGNQHQSMMLKMVEKELIDAVRGDINKLKGKIDAYVQQSSNWHDESGKQFSEFDARVESVAHKTQCLSERLSIEVHALAKKKEVVQVQSSVEEEISNFRNEHQTTNERVVNKLNEFVDHMGKVHELLDDHEHCMRHHAEELENRTTKYDLLMCQDSVETCNEKIDREIRELQKLVNWQTNKIQSFEGAAHKKGKARIKTASDDSPRTPASNWGFSSLKTKESGPPTLEEGKEGVSPCDEESLIDSDDDGPIDSMLKAQMEAISMGIVGLANLVFREPRLGASRNARLEREKELLEQLSLLRYWITHNSVPSGWDPKQMTTAALRASHPSENEPKGPLPQISIKNLSASQRRLRGSRSMMSSYGDLHHSVSPRSQREIEQGSGALNASDEFPAPAKLTLSAKGLTLRDVSLPPLRTDLPVSVC